MVELACKYILYVVLATEEMVAYHIFDETWWKAPGREKNGSLSEFPPFMNKST